MKNYNTSPDPDDEELKLTPEEEAEYERIASELVEGLVHCTAALIVIGAITLVFKIGCWIISLFGN